MTNRMTLDNRTAVITGAASGIGRALAVVLASRRCHLALADVNEAGLAETAQMVASNSLRVSRHVLDVTDRAAIAALPQAVAAEHGGADILINNAGVALGGTFDKVTEENFEWLFEINFWAVVRLTRAFMPLLQVSDDARLVNLSSLYGLIAPPGQTAYSASKFAVRGFSNALRHELQGTKIGVTVVHPGGIATSIAESARRSDGITDEDYQQAMARAKRMLKMPPARAGEIIVDAIERRKGRVLVGNDAKFMALLERLAPVSYWKFIEPLVRRS
jgi:NAD(P)-dependent dehydrogenase (short-subunit alcohol dehydrogenase family)